MLEHISLEVGIISARFGSRQWGSDWAEADLIMSTQTRSLTCINQTSKCAISVPALLLKQLILCLVIVAPPFIPRDTLKAWQEKNHPWLELSDVHRETTENIRVTVIPFYMGMRVKRQDTAFI